jgi:hypothetical protein
MSPALYRQESEISKSDVDSVDQEKGYQTHRETVNVPDAIPEDEEDTGGNVGTAAYEKSKHMAEIVGVLDDSAHPSDPFTEPKSFHRRRPLSRTRPS